MGFEIPRTDSYPATGTPSKPGVRDELSANRIDLRWKQPRPIVAPRGTIRTSGRPVMKATTPDGCDDHEGRPRHQRTHTHRSFTFFARRRRVGEHPNPEASISPRKDARARSHHRNQTNRKREPQSPTRPRHTHARTHARAHRKTFPPNRKEERRKPTVFESYSYPVPLPFSTHSRSGFCCPVPGARRNPAHAEPHRTRRPAPNTTTTALQGRPLSDGL